MISSFRGEHAFLANSYPCDIEIDGICYACAESAFLASRCAYKTDRKRFAGLSAADARKISGNFTERSDWKDSWVSSLREVLTLKFSDGGLLRRLLNTGEEELVYENTWNDTLLGKCGGKGENRLGPLLMELRREAKQKNESEPCSPKQAAFLHHDPEVVSALAVLGLTPELLPKGLASRVISYRISLAKAKGEET